MFKLFNLLFCNSLFIVCHYFQYSEERFNSLRCFAESSLDSLKLHINRRPSYYAMSQRTKTAKQKVHDQDSPLYVSLFAWLHQTFNCFCQLLESQNTFKAIQLFVKSFIYKNLFGKLL